MRKLLIATVTLALLTGCTTHWPSSRALPPEWKPPVQAQQQPLVHHDMEKAKKKCAKPNKHCKKKMKKKKMMKKANPAPAAHPAH